MFVGHEVLLDASFAVARERLVQLTESGALISASEDAYSRGTAGLTRVGAAGLSKLVRVQLRELARTDRVCRAGHPVGGDRTGRRAIPGSGRRSSARFRRRSGHLADRWRAYTGLRSVRWVRRWTGRSCIGSPTRRSGNFAGWLAAQITGRPGAAEATASIVPGLHRQLFPVLLRLRAAGLCGTGGWSRFGSRSFLA